MYFNDFVFCFLKIVIFVENKNFILRKNQLWKKCLKISNEIKRQFQKFLIKIENSTTMKQQNIFYISIKITHYYVISYYILSNSSSDNL